MRKLLIIGLIAGAVACSKKTSKLIDNAEMTPDKVTVTEERVTEILWDEWGVPHIYAKNNADLYYSSGWAQMHSHGNTILQNYAHARGEAAKHWGMEKLENDMLVHALDFPRIAVQWYESQSLEFKTFIQKYVDGMNDYMQANPQSITDENKAIAPIVKEDVLKNYLFVIYTRFIAGDDLNTVKNWEHTGSNTYAVGP